MGGVLQGLEYHKDSYPSSTVQLSVVYRTCHGRRSRRGGGRLSDYANLTINTPMDRCYQIM